VGRRFAATFAALGVIGAAWAGGHYSRSAPSPPDVAVIGEPASFTPPPVVFVAPLWATVTVTPVK
jgi:hypothetical protein